MGRSTLGSQHEERGTRGGRPPSRPGPRGREEGVEGTKGAGRGRAGGRGRQVGGRGPLPPGREPRAPSPKLHPFMVGSGCGGGAEGAEGAGRAEGREAPRRSWLCSGSDRTGAAGGAGRLR